MKAKTLQLINDLSKVNLFGRAGQPSHCDCFPVCSWTEAIKYCSSHQYEVLLNATGNAIRVAVARINRNLYNSTWNLYIDTIKAAIEQPILMSVESQVLKNVFPKEVHDAVAWDVLMACMESEYADVIIESRKLKYVDCLRPGFYTKLMKWYLEGHFPCGWKGGEYPVGKMVVY